MFPLDYRREALAADNVVLQEPALSFSNCYAACKEGKLDIVQSCLAKDPSLISQIDNEGQTLLYACVVYNQLTVMQWLHKQSPLILNLCRNDGQTIMHIAVEFEYCEIVLWLHEQDPALIDRTDQKKLTPLHIAAIHEKISILTIFTENLKKNTLLIQQICKENCPKTLAFILEQNIDPNASFAFKQTLLHLAAEAGQEKNILCLLQHRANINSLDLSNRTPLFLAVTQGHEGVVKLLLKNGADCTIVNAGNETVLHIAANYGHKLLLLELLNDPHCKKLINRVDHDGKTPLHKALWGKPKPEIVQLLVKYGANTDAQNQFGYSSLHWAAKHGHNESARILLEAGSLVTVVNTNHDLPFDLAIREGMDDFVNSLLEGIQTSTQLQILSLLKLAIFYMDAAQEVPEQKAQSLVTSSKIINSIIPLLGIQNAFLKNYLFKRLEENESLFLKNLGLEPPIMIDAIKETRLRLDKIRSQAEKSHHSGLHVQQTLQNLTSGFKQILGEFVIEGQKLLGPVPTKKWACIGIGSMSRGELFPHSGLEFTFLVGKDTSEKGGSEIAKYFYTLSQILELKIVNMGLAQFTSYDEGESGMPNEFHMGDIIASAEYVCIGSPKQLAKSAEGMERALLAALNNTCLIAGDKELKADYDAKVKEIQKIKRKKEGAKSIKSDELLRQIKNHITGFSVDLSIGSAKYFVKNELYRPFQDLLDCLCLIYNVNLAKNTSTFDQLKALKKIGVFSIEGANILTETIERLFSLQLELGFFYKGREELLYYPHGEEAQDANLLYFDEKFVLSLRKMHMTLSSLHHAMSTSYPFVPIVKQNNTTTPLLNLHISVEQDDFIQFFLRNKIRLPKSQPSQDLEAWYCKRLLEAKAQGFVEEQVLYLQKLSSMYVNKKEFVKAVKVLNCAIPLSNGKNLLLECYLINALEEIEELFLKSNGIDAPKTNGIKDKRLCLAGIRETAKNYHEVSIPIQEILRYITENFEGLLRSLILEGQQLLGRPPPVKWACIGMGSMSRGEMCPYSDIEFAFLIEKDTEEAMDYFRMLSKIIELKVVNLGETKYPIFGINYESPTPNGFCLDSGGNTPLGKPGLYELIGTPEQLARFQSLKEIHQDIILPNALSNVCLVAGDEKLQASYLEEKKKVQLLKEQKKGELIENRQELAMCLLKGHLVEFSPELSKEKRKEKEQEPAFGVKKELYRPFQEILGCLCLLYDLKEKSTIARIDELMRLNVFSFEGAENLKRAFCQVLSLRLEVHLFYKDEKEFLCHSEVEKPQDPCLYYFNETNIQLLLEIYKVLLPFHKAAAEFSKEMNIETLNKSSFYDDSFLAKAKAFQIKEPKLPSRDAFEACQQAMTLNPHDTGAQLMSSLIKHDTRNRLKGFEQVIEFYEQIGGIEDFYDALNKAPALSSDFAELPSPEDLGQYSDIMLKAHQSAIVIKSDILGDEDLDLASSYTGVAQGYCLQEKFKEGIEFYHKELNIRIKIQGSFNIDVAKCYENIAEVHTKLGEYKQALEFQRKALKVLLTLSDHAAISNMYLNISTTYGKIGKTKKSQHYSHKALKIQARNPSENHPDANLISVIRSDFYKEEMLLEILKKAVKNDGFTKFLGQPLDELLPDIALFHKSVGIQFGDRGNHRKKLEHYLEALSIQLKVLGENHPDLAATYNAIARIYKDLEEYDKAFEYTQNALRVRTRVSGEIHLDVAKSYKIMGSVWCELLDHKQSLECYQKTLNIELQVLGKNHSDLALTYNGIGMAYFRLKDFHKALENCQKSLQIELLDIDESHPNLIVYYKNIGLIHYELGNNQEALVHYQKSLEIQIQTLGENLLDLATDYCTIANVYYRLEDYQKAIEYYQKYLPLRKLKIGSENHPDIFNAYICIGLAYEDLKNFEKALEYFEMGLVIQIPLIGENHSDWALFYRRVGRVHGSLGNDQKALEFYQKALKIFREDFAKNHSRIIRDSCAIAAIYDKIKDYQKALENYEIALGIEIETLGENHSDVAISYDNIAQTYKSLGNNEKALESYHQALDTRLQVFGDRHLDLASNYTNIGSLYYKLGKYEIALEFHYKALNIRNQNEEYDNLDVANCYDWIADSYEELGNQEIELEYRLKYAKIIARIKGDHLDVTSSYSNIAVMYFNQQEYENALDFHQKALEIKRRILPKNDPSIAKSYHNIGMVYSRMNDDTKALENYQAGLEIRLQVLDEDDSDLAKSYYEIGEAHKKLKDYEIALEFYQKALAIERKVLGEIHSDVAISYNNIGSSYSLLKEDEQALAYYQKALDTFLKSGAPHDFNLCQIYINLSWNVYDFGDYQQAAEYEEKVLEIQLNTDAGDDKIAIRYNNIGFYLGKFGQHQKALDSHQMALALRIVICGSEEHVDVARSYGHIGVAYNGLGDYEKSLEYNQKALAIKLRAYGTEEHVNIAKSYYDLGDTYRGKKEYKISLEQHQKALLLRQKLCGKESFDLVESYHAIGTTLECMKSYHEAIENFQLALEILQNSGRGKHPIVTDLQNLIALAAWNECCL